MPANVPFFFDCSPELEDSTPFYHGPRAEGGSVYGRKDPILILLRPQGPSMAPTGIQGLSSTDPKKLEAEGGHRRAGLWTH